MFTLSRSPIRRRSRPILEELESRTLLSASILDNLPTAHQLILTPASGADVSLDPQRHPGGGGGGSTTPPGYSPGQIQSAYGFSQLYNSGLNGANQTIAIVDAYNDPNIQKDLASFDSKFNLSSANLRVVNQSGGTSLPQSNSGWALEIAMDVEWAHAMAPGANIVLVEAASNSLSDLLTAVQYAATKSGASVVSLSWGSGEFSGETSYDSYFTTPGVTFVAASGDSGAPPEWPAVSPSVLAVGGTTLTLNSNNGISSESAWSSSSGGISAYESQPGYQQGVVTQSSTKRTSPDVAYNANPNTGFAVYDTVSYYGQTGWFEVGGTSAGAPQWSALVAIANEGRALAGLTSLSGGSQTLPALYSNAATLNDIISGSNNGFSAGTGYDLVTGLGSPKANAVVQALVSLTSTPSGTTTPAATGSSTTSNTAKKSDALGGDSGQSASGPISFALLFEALAASDPTILVQPAQLSTTIFPFGTASVLSSAFGTNQSLGAVGGISPSQASSSLNAVFGYQFFAPAPKSISSPPENLGNYLSPFRSYSPDAVPTTGADESEELGGDGTQFTRRTIRISSFLREIDLEPAPAAPTERQDEEAPACDAYFVDEASMAFLAEEGLAEVSGANEFLLRLRVPTLALLGVLANSFWMVPDAAEETRKRRVLLV